MIGSLGDFLLSQKLHAGQSVGKMIGFVDYLRLALQDSVTGLKDHPGTAWPRISGSLKSIYSYCLRAPK